MTKLYCTLLCLTCSIYLSAQQFTPAETLISNTGVSTSSPNYLTYKFKAVELNGDGLFHFMGRTNNDGIFDLYLNDGNNNFTKETKTVGTDVLPMFIRDFNNDGHLDVLSHHKHLLLNEGNNNFIKIDNIDQGVQDEQRVAVDDFNGDGLLDYLSLHRFKEHLVYYEAGANNQFTPTLVDDFDNDGHGYVISGDFNDDGHLDIIKNNREFIVYENDGNGNFTLNHTLSAIDLYSPLYSFCAFEDLDNDGDKELIGADGDLGIYFLENIDGSYSTEATLIEEFFSSWYIHTAIVEDINNDGYLDILTLEQNSDLSVKYFENNNGSGFKEPIVVHEMQGATPFSNPGETKLYLDLVQVVDLDSDGMKDIIINDMVGQQILRVEYQVTNNTAEVQPKDLIIFPNPTSEYIHVKNFEHYSNCDIIGIDGSKIATRNVRSQIDISTLPSGQYFLSLMNKKGDFESYPFTKQ